MLLRPNYGIIRTNNHLSRLTCDSSAFPFSAALSQESSRHFISLYFLIIKLSTTQNMMDYRREDLGSDQLLNPPQEKEAALTFTMKGTMSMTRASSS